MNWRAGVLLTLISLSRLAATVLPETLTPVETLLLTGVVRDENFNPVSAARIVRTITSKRHGTFAGGLLSTDGSLSMRPRTLTTNCISMRPDSSLL